MIKLKVDNCCVEADFSGDVIELVGESVEILDAIYRGLSETSPEAAVLYYFGMIKAVKDPNLWGVNGKFPPDSVYLANKTKDGGLA